MARKQTMKIPRSIKCQMVKKNIYNCAMDLFEKNGFDNVKVSDICKASNISVGTFYYYFPSKEAILLFYGEESDDVMETIKLSLNTTSAEELLRTLIIEKVKLSTSHGAELSNCSMIAFFKHHDDVAFDFHRSAYAYFMRAIEDGMRSGEFRSDLNIYNVTSNLRYMIGGLVAHWSIIEGKFDIEQEAMRLSNDFIMLLKPCR